MPTKPDPALLTDHILPQFPHHCEGSAILMVGDTEIDIVFAQAGRNCVLLGGLRLWRQRALPRACAGRRIESIEELPAAHAAEHDLR